ncbi:hypothetical protein BDW74DRAFT_160554 [Aspergillus multicolor]|uniref:uncharacterized protein n=1 Tax=Aspergillus multicolor TaxID=41759 RepID=UPI003CCDF61C
MNKLEQMARPIAEYREQQTPRSFSSRHRRSLTISGPNDTYRRTESQGQAWFFRLPREVREIVYVDVLCGSNLHIWRKEGKVHVSRCRVANSTEINNYDSCDAIFGHVDSERPPCVDSDKQYSAIGLLASCRRIYTEVIQFIFEKNTFHLSHRTLNRLPQAMIPIRLSSIRSLRLYVPFSDSELPTWKRASAVLKRMPGLRSLHVLFGPFWVCCTGIDAMPRLEPLLGLRVADFAVQLLDCMMVDGLRVKQWALRSAELPFRVVIRNLERENELRFQQQLMLKRRWYSLSDN